MKRGKTLVRTMVGLLLAGAMLGFAVPASAATPTPPVPSLASTATEKSVSKPVTLGSAATPSGVPFSCFGYTGYFMPGSTILVQDWTGDGVWDECFGIAPNRVIYHAWPSSGGWQIMPHNGRADNMVEALHDSEGYRKVVVTVNGIGDYCSTLMGSWQPWVRC